MRGVVLAAAVMLGSVASAQAADMPDFLRGSLPGGYSPPVNWRGFYLGGQAAWANSTQNFSGSTMDRSLFPKVVAGNVVGEIPGLTAPIPFGLSSKGTTGFGAFTGYNWQWDEAVLGLDISYLHGGFGGSVSAVRQFASTGALSDGLFHDPKVTSTSTIGISDYATFRARAGYAYNCFMPYAFGGFALGYASVLSSVRVDDFASGAAGGPFFAVSPFSGISAGENHVIYGYTAGLGVDINLYAGLFVRAEWEYVRFTQQVDVNMNTVRAGLGYKF
jgi:opacity protein-like surface antigen